jgi:hypothetical protein
MLESNTLFIAFELAYLLIFVILAFKKSEILTISAYCLAGLKYSLASLQSIDIYTYENIYNTVDHFVGLETVEGQEGGFVSLMYIAKQLNIPLPYLHFVEIVLLLLALRFLLKFFLPSSQAAAMSVLFGFVAVGGELCMYLLRVMVAAVIGSASLIFHSSSIFYLPFFISSYFSKNNIRLPVLLGSFALFGLVVYNVDVGISLIASITGEASTFYLKYLTYTRDTHLMDGRDAKVGFISQVLMLYFSIIFTYKWKEILQPTNKASIFYVFTLAITVVYIALESLDVFWISSRLNVISKMFLVASCLLLTIDILPKKLFGIIMSIFGTMICFVSIILIMQGYASHSLFKLPI